MAGKRTYSLNKNSVKKCNKCGQFKNVAEFGWVNKKRGWKQSQCRECTRKKLYTHYKKKIKPIHDYLKAHPCVDCGETDFRVLEFDHVRGEKNFNVGSSWSKPWHLIEKEMSKCEVRCKNCHAKRHWEDGYGDIGPKIKDEDAIEYYDIEESSANQTSGWWQTSLI